MNIGGKLYTGFGAVLAVFVAVLIYVIVSLNLLHDVEDESAGRANDAIELQVIAGDVGEMYAVIADGIINRDVDEFRSGLAEIRQQAERDGARLHELADTAEERANADEFSSVIDSYLDTAEHELLPILEKEESVADRAKDSIAIMKVEIRVGSLYAVMADGIINQNIEETEQDFASAKAAAEQDISLVSSLVDTDEERANAGSFEQAYRSYLGAFESQVLPELRQGEPDMEVLRNLDEVLDQARTAVIERLQDISASLEDETAEVLADEQTIRDLDGTIDGFRNRAVTAIELIAESLREEQVESAEVFDATIKRVKTLSLALAAIGALAAVAIAYGITRSIAKPLVRLTNSADRIALGDFGVEDVEVKNRDELGNLAKSFAEMLSSLRYKAQIIEEIATGDLTSDIELSSDVDSLGKSLITMSDALNQLLGQVAIAIQQVSSGATQVSESGQSLSQGATEQASSLEEISASLTEINAQSKQNADRANEATTIAKDAVENAQTGNDRMKGLLGAMDRINSASDEISKVVKVIDDIAFQINLLALNANVEAARAGKYGKGFAVVADEVRNLAVRSAEAVKETTGMVEQTTSAIQDGSTAAEATGVQLDEIFKGATSVATILEEIAHASSEQASGVEQTNSGIEQIDQVTQSNTANAEESASAGEELASQARELEAMIARFKLKSAEQHIAVAEDSMHDPQIEHSHEALPAPLMS